MTPGNPLPKWQMQASWARALGRLGHEVRVVKYTPDDRIRLGWGERIKWNIRVIREIREFGRAGLIIYSLGADVLLPWALYYIKARLEAPLVVLSGVSPIKQGNPRERAMAPLVDLAATNDEGQAEEWLKLGAKRAVVLPISAIDPELHWERRIRGIRGKRRTRDIDVLFAGTLTAERRRFFDKLRLLLPKTVKMVVKEFVWEEEYAELMSRAKVGINLLRPEMKHGVNLRTFEIPAFGAMEITSFCRKEWLVPGKEVEVFGSAKEAAELVKKYLKDDRAREGMAAAGQKRVMREHTFDERAERLMETVKEISGNLLVRRHPLATLGVASDGSSLTRKFANFDSFSSAKLVKDNKNKWIDISVCIVNYKADEELRRCVESVKKFTKEVSYEVIVIDNSEDNRWYSGGNNLGLKRAKGKYVLFLNPDCWLESDAISDLAGWMDKHPAAGAAEPRQVYETGEAAPTGSLLPKWWIDAVEMTGLSGLFGRLGNLGILGRLGRLGKFGELDKYRQIHFDRAKNWRTEAVSGAAMMARREVLDKIGGFDENLKLYYTDVDLCRRIKRAGWEIWHIGETAVRHKTRASTSKLPWDRLNLIYAADGLEYYRKWGEGIGGKILYWGMKGNSKIIKIIK